ncbi:MAG: (4Fe-4S)-binding protein [Candidatus Neomarinimicrobiota bacterium]|nr:MAG: (4Fe-4S)-binding protein [Candidatus Neomarinimicrobiota bacterium]
MKIAIASGKGGTGKTTIAVNIAKSLGENVQLLDCDVEEPNSHIFLQPEILRVENVSVSIPYVDLSRCTFCGKCQEICQFSAIVVIKNSVLVFPELCHSCAGCWLVCPENCIAQKERIVGVTEEGENGDIKFVHGRLDIGEVMSLPLIRAVKNRTANSMIVIIDAPPGTSCPVIEAVSGSDFVILVTEPTPFGLHDLVLAVEVVRTLGISFGVVINRSDIGDNKVREYCDSENIPILFEIPNDRKIAEAYSKGKIIIDIYPEYRRKFLDLYEKIESMVTV